MKRRLLGLLLAGMLCLSLLGCGAKEAGKVDNTEKTITNSAVNATNNQKNEKTQESETTVDTESEPETIAQDMAKDYVGEWMDNYSQRCKMTITSADGVNFKIDINWGSSAWENTHWTFDGKYNASKHGLEYTGSCIEEVYAQDAGDNAAATETVTYSDGTGLLTLKDGLMYWQNDKEDTGNQCFFQKLN